MTKPPYYKEFLNIAQSVGEISELINIKDFEQWRTLGLNLVCDELGRVVPKCKFTQLCDEIFCIVDIETSGGLKNGGQIIEIGAVKMQNFTILDSFETLVYCDYVPGNISALTGIYQSDLLSAPSLKTALEMFKIFLKDHIFVAHNVRFDYNFISFSLNLIGFGMLLNPRLCTIDLARRTIPSQRYGLECLKELLGIKNQHHRALNDAIAATEILKHSLLALPNSVKSTFDLINFSKIAKSVVLPKSEINLGEN